MSDVFFMLASPDNNDDHHIEVLAQISTKSIEDGFVTKLKAVESVEEAQELFLEANSDSFDSYASSQSGVEGARLRATIVSLPSASLMTSRALICVSVSLKRTRIDPSSRAMDL